MKNKILAIVFTTIMILSVSVTAYAAITHTMVNDGGGGGGSSSSTSTSHTCKWGTYSTVTSATCTSGGSEKASCTVSGCTKTNTRSTSELGHSWGSWYYYSSNQHKRDCGRSGCSSSETVNHNKNIKEDFGNNDLHDVRCDACNWKWPAAQREKHTWAAAEGVHTCSNCGYVLSGIYHYYEDATGEAKSSYDCSYKATGKPCTYSISLNIPEIKGLPISDYTPSDSTVGMPTPPPFPEGTYTYKYSGVVRNGPNSLATLKMKCITVMKMNSKHFMIYEKLLKNI